MSWIIIHLMGGIIMSVVDSLWMCYALDVFHGMRDSPAPHVAAVIVVYHEKADSCAAAHQKEASCHPARAHARYPLPSIVVTHAVGATARIISHTRNVQTGGAATYAALGDECIIEEYR